jgi:hypothetical protein
MKKIEEVNDSFEKEGDTLEGSRINGGSGLESSGGVVRIEDKAGAFIGEGGEKKEINLFNNDQEGGEEPLGKFLIGCTKQDFGKVPASECLDDKNPMSFGDSSKVNTNFGQSKGTDGEKSSRKLSELNHNNYNESSVNQSGTQIYDSKMILEEFNRDIGEGLQKDENQSSEASDDNETSQILLVSMDKTISSSKATAILPKDKPLTSMVILNKHCQEEDFKNMGGHAADDLSHTMGVPKNSSRSFVNESLEPNAVTTMLVQSKKVSKGFGNKKLEKNLEVTSMRSIST